MTRQTLAHYEAVIAESSGSDRHRIYAASDAQAMDAAADWARSGDWQQPGYVTVVLYLGDEQIDSRRIAVGPPDDVPKTTEAAIDALVALDVAQWGEAERDAARRNRQSQRLTYGLALNALAHHYMNDYGDKVPHLVAAAKAALTEDDRHRLRS